MNLQKHETHEEETIQTEPQKTYFYFFYFRKSLDQFLFSRWRICSNIREDMFLIKGFIWSVNF